MIAEPALICPCFVGDLSEALGPVISAPGVDLDRFVREMNLHSIAIELDFVYPAFAAGHLLDGCRKRGLDEAGKGSLDADGRRFLPHAQPSRCRVVGA